MAKKIKEEEKGYYYIRLILIDGSVIQIEYWEDSPCFDEAFEEMRECIEKGTIWNVDNYSEWKATFKGMGLENINCRLVIGYN